MINLIRKDLKIFYGETSITKKRIAKDLGKILFYVFVVGVLYFIFSNILKKTSVYPNASMTLLSLFMFGISLIQVFSYVSKAKRLIFEEKDFHLMSILPVSPLKCIVSKLLLIFISYIQTTLIFTLPLLIAYGRVSSLPIQFYFLAILYPLMILPVDIGFTLFIVCPYKIIKDKLTSHYYIKSVFYIIVFFGLAFIYSRVLNIFVTLVAGGDLLTIFTQEKINMFSRLTKFEIPYYLLELLIHNKLHYILAIILGTIFFILSICFVSYFYLHQMKKVDKSRSKKKQPTYKKQSILHTLIVKEIRVLIKNESYLLSYVSLLVLQPFLGYLIIYALNTIFRAGTFSYYLLIVPDFISILDLFLLILLGVIINQGASSYIQDERRTLLLMKSIPVSYKTQLLVKIMIPYLMSSLSFIITDMVLFFTKVISLQTFIVGFILVLMILFIFDSICLYEELKMNVKKGRSYTFSSIYTYVIPFIFFLTSVLLSCFGVNIVISYLIGASLFLLSGIFFIIYIFKNMEKAFASIEAIASSQEWRN